MPDESLRQDYIASLERNQVLQLEIKQLKSQIANATDVPRAAREWRPKAIYDDVEGINRCTECCWEVVEGFCEACQKAHKEAHILYDSDREQAPRGTTPLRDEQPTRPLPGYTLEHYTDLVQRGATRLMIENFHLEFSPDRGIFAWADFELYEEFAGPKMRKGDFWKIQLGRRFVLDEDDHDGSAFIEGILEDAIIFPTSGGAKWETVQESPGIWVTQIASINDMDDEHSANGEDTEVGEEEDEEKEKDEEQDEEAEIGEEVDMHDDDDEEDKDNVDEDDDEIEIWVGQETYPTENIYLADDGPILTRPGYDTSDDHASDVELDGVMDMDSVSNPGVAYDVDMIEDPSVAIQAAVCDATYDPDFGQPAEEELQFQTTPLLEGSENANGYAGDEQMVADGEDDEAETATLDFDSDSDSADDDFDDDETMSGDELVLLESVLLFS
ncbi:hypothetical protein H0H92_004373 [Tricholoma furcatifolium]|nr:hypothetical protein H0H92_004373 [Tricholoma furcatifolium]